MVHTQTYEGTEMPMHCLYMYFCLMKHENDISNLQIDPLSIGVLL